MRSIAALLSAYSSILIVSSEHVWKMQGFSECSVSCMGGIQESVINCVDKEELAIVNPLFCERLPKPEVIVKACNEQPCPHHWNSSEFQPCSKSCGIGIQTREVICIYNVGKNKAVVVPNYLCPQPPPPDRQFCNILDCPVQWELTEWSKCSQSCGGGVKVREVACKQVMAQNHVVDRPPSECGVHKPPDRKPCNVRRCPRNEHERRHDKQPVDKKCGPLWDAPHIQQYAAGRKASLSTECRAIVFEETEVNIQCSIKVTRSKITWWKDDEPVSDSNKYTINEDGTLSIQDTTVSDSGIYKCQSGSNSSEMDLLVLTVGGQADDLEIPYVAGERPIVV